MKREFSAGGVVFKKNPLQILLIKNSSMSDPTKVYWGFPKGKIDPGESSKAAALREVSEETGVKAAIIEKIGDSKYVFTDKGEKIFKVVVIFLMELLGGELKRQEDEVLEVGWFNEEEALGKLSFTNDKKILKNGIEVIRRL